MAKTNKYASINFNNVYEKNLSNGGSANGNGTTKHSSSYSSTVTSPGSARTHGRMLVLTRPTTKPFSSSPGSASPSPTSPLVSPSKPQSTPPAVQISDPISLRPLGKTGGGPLVNTPPPILGQEKEREVLGSPKPDKFVPPHLRPGFVARQPEGFSGKEAGQRQYPNQQFGSPSGRFGNDGRPNSGGGTRRIGGGDAELGLLNRPRSGGSRPSSSG